MARKHCALIHLPLSAGTNVCFRRGLSWADLIVLAGTVALEDAAASAGSALQLEFCGGRTDLEEDDGGSDDLEPRVVGFANESIVTLRDYAAVMSLTDREFVALLGGGHSLGRMHPERSGFVGQWSDAPMSLDNQLLRTLLAERWEPFGDGASLQYKAAGRELFALGTDLQLRWDAEFAAVAMELAADNEQFLAELAAAWSKLMNADRFAGPAGNLCYGPPPAAEAAEEERKRGGWLAELLRAA